MIWTLVFGILSGCSTSTSVAPLESTSGGSASAYEPGVAPHVWEEPMVDVVEVPPGLDPEGTYYRPAHKEVIEIRQGRWRHQKDAQ